MDIGQQLHNLRIEKNLTQEELGERTDLSKGYISQLEHDQSSPSMETFLSILEVLGVSPADFFAATEQEDKVVFSQSEQTTYTNDDAGYTLSWLVPESNENDMEPVQVSLQAGGAFKTFDPSPGETLVLVTQGRICLHLGPRDYVAYAGDTLYFHAREPHQITNDVATTSTFILVATASYL